MNSLPRSAARRGLPRALAARIENAFSEAQAAARSADTARMDAATRLVKRVTDEIHLFDAVAGARSATGSANVIEALAKRAR